MIRIHQLRYQYAGGASLSFSDLSVAQGATLLLRGPSGSGKSTWLALVAGLRTAAAGEVMVANQSLGALGPSARDAWRAAHVGFLPQQLHLSEALTVAQNLSLVYFAAGLATDADAIARVLEGLGVADLARRKPSELSGGQAQRVALARAVLREPKVILADEPTASLDDAAAEAALGWLQTSAQRCAATLVIATHDRRVEERFPDAMVHQIGLDAPIKRREAL